VRLCHVSAVVFDDPNLVSCAGLAPVLQLAERAGLQDLVGEHVRIDKPGGGNAHLKVPALVAEMITGADSLEDMGLLQHGAMGRSFTGVRAPSTLGTFLRSFTFGHVRQLDAVASQLLINLCRQAPLLAGADQLAYLDIDDTVKPTFGYAKQGAGRGYTGVKGLNVLLATVSTATSRPLVVAARLRKGSSNSAKGAHRLVADALITDRSCGATGLWCCGPTRPTTSPTCSPRCCAARSASQSPPGCFPRSARPSTAFPPTAGPRSSTPTPSSTRTPSAGVNSGF